MLAIGELHVQAFIILALQQNEELLNRFKTNLQKPEKERCLAFECEETQVDDDEHIRMFVALCAGRFGEDTIGHCCVAPMDYIPRGHFDTLFKSVMYDASTVAAL